MKEDTTCRPASKLSSSQERLVMSATKGNPQSIVILIWEPTGKTLTIVPANWFRALLGALFSDRDVMVISHDGGTW